MRTKAYAAFALQLFLIIGTGVAFILVMLNDHKYGFEIKALVSFAVFLPDFIMILWVGEAIYRLKKNSSQSYQISRSTLLMQCTTFVMVVFSEFIAFCAYFKTETVASLLAVMLLRARASSDASTDTPEIEPSNKQKGHILTPSVARRR